MSYHKDSFSLCFHQLKVIYVIKTSFFRKKISVVGLDARSKELLTIQIKRNKQIPCSWRGSIGLGPPCIVSEKSTDSIVRHKAILVSQ